MPDKSDSGEWFMVVGLMAGFFAGIILNPGGYTLIANIAMAGAGALIGGFLGLFLGRAVQLIRDGKDKDSAA